MKLATIAFLALSFVPLLGADAPASPYAKWTHGPSTDPGFFPLMVWLQSPSNAQQYKAAGFNTYIGLWKGPTEEQIAALKAADMKLICDQNDVGLKHLDDPTIIAWMHGDEPDNAQKVPGGKGFGPPVAPSKIISEYDQVAKADPTRPVVLNLGLSVAFNDWGGRGVRKGHAEDYPDYIRGADMVSFDIYPVSGGPKEIVDKVWYVAKGVDHLVQIGKGEKIVLHCLECTHIESASKIATPAQVRAEAWMGIVHGSMGLIYFVHQLKPTVVEDGLLHDPDMLAAVTALNKEIIGLAPQLNSPSVTDAVQVQSDSNAPVDTMVKRDADSTYIFATAMRDVTAKPTFTVAGLKGPSTVTVINENRTINAMDGVFTDSFDPWGVHLYKIPNH